MSDEEFLASYNSDTATKEEELCPMKTTDGTISLENLFNTATAKPNILTKR